MNESSFTGSCGFAKIGLLIQTFFPPTIKICESWNILEMLFYNPDHLKFYNRNSSFKVTVYCGATMKQPQSYWFVGSNVGVFKKVLCKRVYTIVRLKKDFWVCRDTLCKDDSAYLRSSCPDSRVDMREGASVKGTAPQEEWHDCCAHTNLQSCLLSPFLSFPFDDSSHPGRESEGGGKKREKCERWHKEKPAESIFLLFMFQSLPEPIEYITHEVFYRHLLLPVPQGVSKKDCIPLFF